MTRDLNTFVSSLFVWRNEGNCYGICNRIGCQGERDLFHMSKYLGFEDVDQFLLALSVPIQLVEFEALLFSLIFFHIYLLV